MPDITQESTDPHYAAIGRVAAMWASFEHDLQSQIWAIAGISNSIGACITSQIGISGRLVDCLLALLAFRGISDDDLKPFRSFGEEIGRKQRKRNRIIHDPWHLDFPDEELPPKPYRLEISAATKLVLRPVAHATEDVDKFINEIILLKNELRRHFERYNRLIEIAKLSESP
jgi:hypothetical protein